MPDRDFTLQAYGDYLDAVKARQTPFRTVEQLMRDGMPDTFCLLRHDVDRLPGRALAMAELEAAKGAMATYYFRLCPSSFKAPIIRRISELGHEIGFHYESLSDARGDHAKAHELFARGVEQFSELGIAVKTIAMHGRPLRPEDNRDMWRAPENRQRLRDQFAILGEAYLDLDYRDVAYLTDTGRRWDSTTTNLRDQVNSDVTPTIRSREDMLAYLRSPERANRLVLQVHPERWTDHPLGWWTSWFTDKGTNAAKRLIRLTRS